MLPLILFYIFATVLVLAAVAVIVARNPVYSAPADHELGRRLARVKDVLARAGIERVGHGLQRLRPAAERGPGAERGRRGRDDRVDLGIGGLGDRLSDRFCGTRVIRLNHQLSYFGLGSGLRPRLARKSKSQPSLAWVMCSF